MTSPPSPQPGPAEGGLEGALKPAAEALSGALAGREVLCFANDWKGDPTSKHHVMRTLAEHVPVTWVESSGMRRPKLMDPADIRRIFGKLKGVWRGSSGTAEEPVRVATPLSLPLPGWAVVDRVNRRIYGRAIRRARPELTRDPAAALQWVYTPTVEPLLDGLPGNGLVYHCVDRWWEFSEYDATLMRRCHERLCRRADVVFASARALLDDCAPYSDNAHLMRHGVDWDHFAVSALAPPPVPHDLADVSGPVVGFFGLLHDWIDLELIGAVADALPDVTVTILGKARVDVSKLAARRNVRLLGQKPYTSLPGYAARFTVGIIPFRVNQLTVAVNPIKLREYLAAGLPVVSTPLPELLPYESHAWVQLAGTAESFVEAVRTLTLDPPDQSARRELARSMATESWVGKTAEMVRLWEAAAGD